MGDYGSGGGGGVPQGATPASQADSQDVINLKKQLELLQQQNEAERRKQELAKSAMPELTYNPIEETVGPDGKKTIGLRKEFQLGGPEDYIAKERERLGLEKAMGLDQLRQEQAQKEAQQRAMMATRGGLRGGASALTKYSMRDALAARQGLLGSQARQASEFESNAEKMRKATEEKNLENLLKGVSGVEQFNLERWKKMKDVEASKNQAEATRAAGGSGSKK
ncbi:hypothetical protein EBR78_10455 [bacterium]|nr:hypothetical protein [bacterium]